MTLQAPAAPIFRRLVSGTVRAGVEELAGSPVMVVRSVSTVRRGALSVDDGESIRVAAAAALAFRIPILLVLASSGADVSDGVASLHGWGQAARALTMCSGVVPVMVVVSGPAISGPALLLGLADLVVMTSDAFAFVSGPAMVEEFTGVRIGIHQLGGTSMHARSSGLCAIEAATEEDAVAHVEHLVSLLPANADELAPRVMIGDPADREVDDLREIIPARTTSSYDVRRVAEALADDHDVTELWTRWSPQLVTALGRIDGRTVGFVANQPQALAGTLDIAASQKGAQFVRFCDSFNLPLVTLVDTPGFLPGKDLEWRGMIRHGAELAFAYAEATVPRVCVILRKAFGGAYIVMDSKGLGNDLCFAWPGAEIAVMGAEGAVQILHRNAQPDEREGLQAEYTERFLTPYQASERGFVDAVIDPASTRAVVAEALGTLETAREMLPGRKHTVGPL
ncbi:MAG TPA: carboxyl transferase domain-containing protein [Acidimicrobiales bacterium]|nr:carboxyl transferase domain-containing protein [Acidimicrobiales bacterium]